MMRLAILIGGLALAACAGGAEVCHFPSGRSCAPGEVCLGVKGDECNYDTCDRGALVGGGVACTHAAIAPAPGGPFACDPALLAAPAGAATLTPPPSPCPLGGLYTIVNGGFGACVPIAQCAALACDPAFGGDGCPSGQACAEESSTCVGGA